MKEVRFYKYQGTGNDFVLVDQMDDHVVSYTTQEIASICDRRFGIGADGFMILRPKHGFDFEMVYYNSDGNPSSMCGNGGRCIVKMAYDLGYIGESCSFLAVDGPHTAQIQGQHVALRMIDVDHVSELGSDKYEVQTGSPHFVAIETDADRLKHIVSYGKEVRYSDTYKSAGINVNLVVKNTRNAISMATYERGVEDETYSCGTGVTAAALVVGHLDNSVDAVDVKTRGGDLKVTFKRVGTSFEDIDLIGPAEFVFEGIIKI